MAPFASDRCRKLILIYHSIGGTPWAVSKKSFGAQMDWLCRVGKITPLNELLDQNVDGATRVAITFDDGYASLHDVALPILEGVGAVATVFPNTGCVGAGGVRNLSDPALGHYPGESFLSWQDMKRLSVAGWSVGSHGVAHLDLTVAHEDTVREELTASKNMIEKIVGLPCPTFAYTWGRHTPRLRRLVAEAGYRYGLSGRHGSVRSDGDPLAVPRINISKEYTLSDFQSITRGDWDYLGWIQGMKGL